jgi:pimeloyl-ACP methyl ester carboxylesterase
LRTGFVEHRDSTLAYVEGNADRLGAPLVMMHGIMLSAGYWALLLERMMPHRRWISLSLPGHYPSQLSPELRPADLDEEFFAELLDAALDQLRIAGPVVLAGHSTGGFAALNHAARRPGRACAVVSIAGFALGRWRGMEGLQQRLTHWGWLGNRLFDLSYRAGVLSRSTYRLSSAIYAGDRRRYLANPMLRQITEATYDDVRRHPLRQLRPLFNRTRDYDIRPLLPRITVPVLLIVADRDSVIPLTHSRYLAENIPSAQLHVVHDKGHLMYLEAPEEFGATLCGWLDLVAAVPPPGPVGGERRG